MNCTEACKHLPALLYGDLSPTEAAALELHLTGCPACRREYVSLDRVRRALDLVPVPAVEVDLARLYQEAATRQTRGTRRWRWGAAGCAAAAAVLLLVLGLRLEVRMEAHQLVLRWGAPAQQADPVLPPEPPRAQVIPPLSPTSPEVEERLRVMSELIHALAEDVGERDAQQKEQLALLEAHLQKLQLQGNLRWTETERTFAALCVAQFGKPKGEKQ
jgi:hypothetical protein